MCVLQALPSPGELRERMATLSSDLMAFNGCAPISMQCLFYHLYFIVCFLQALPSPGELRERMATLSSDLVALNGSVAANQADAQHATERADKAEAEAQVSLLFFSWCHFSATISKYEWWLKSGSVAANQADAQHASERADKAEADAQVSRLGVCWYSVSVCHYWQLGRK